MTTQCNEEEEDKGCWYANPNTLGEAIATLLTRVTSWLCMLFLLLQCVPRYFHPLPLQFWLPRVLNQTSQSPVHLFQPCAGGSTDLGLYKPTPPTSVWCSCNWNAPSCSSITALRLVVVRLLVRWYTALAGTQDGSMQVGGGLSHLEATGGALVTKSVLSFCQILCKT